MKEYDIFLFLGQSNMAGRGITSEEFPETWPVVTEGAGFEYRAVTDPYGLHPITEPFGIEENRDDGINDRWGERRAKSGGMVSAFVNEYYRNTGVPIIGLSASKGGSRIDEWLPGTPYFTDMMQRIDSLLIYLVKNDIKVGHMNVLYCQGESDGDVGTTPEEYRKRFSMLKEALHTKGFENVFMVLIGKLNEEGRHDLYDEIRNTQIEMIESEKDMYLASDLFPLMLERGLMKDKFHYYQKAYNEVGKDAGRKVSSMIYDR